ncbi:unnamed protein product [Blepharisma stoltei]|uniref:ATP synthase F0 subunit 8 n=1 Tax=Blepharisma stoltei TaxID=1481888 RepID=A0AAU9KJT9_9CILI|nr:unnamed protein product [Blepharisma stoltei]
MTCSSSALENRWGLLLISGLILSGFWIFSDWIPIISRRSVGLNPTKLCIFSKRVCFHIHATFNWICNFYYSLKFD